ncbi:CNP1-like family protein [Hydrogenophaga sp.]|uniref:CNP1-like family protein n=1 Tax=Hydrogenophaga sp. TaxID=1904254 RepID=UPI00262238E0|nr:CNP1-like family protein [Hydrogenophaga sp.]MCW5654640.1 CNP1-like family protein [Hydrogenophaga sp.]
MKRNLGLMLALTGFGMAVFAATTDEEPAWQEALVEAPASFSTERLQTFKVSQGSSLVYGIDPETLSLGPDWVVRYVLVARSASGALNVFYDGIRCQTAEVKTYARWDNNRAAWRTTENAEWKALSYSGATRPAMVLALEGLCNGKSANGDTRKMLATLKSDQPYLQR